MMTEVLNLSKEKTTLKVFRMKSKPNHCKKEFSIPLEHVSDSMDEFRQL